LQLQIFSFVSSSLHFLLKMPGTSYDPFKIYRFGDAELAARTDIVSLSSEVQDYAKLKAQYAGTSGFVDPAFPHTNQSIGKIGHDTANPEVTGEEFPIIWLRPKEALRRSPIVYADYTQTDPTVHYVTKFSSTDGQSDTLCRFDITQGGIGDCYFVASLAAVTTNQKALSFVIPSDTNDDPRSGVYHFRFWHQGCWVDVVVDDYLPFNQKNGYMTTYGAKIIPVGNTVEFWVALAEKAYAKLRGGYGNISSGGTILAALQTLTGGFVEGYNLEPGKYPDSMFEKIQGVLAKDSLIGVGTGTDAAAQQVAKDKGIPAQHAYTVTKAETVKTNSGEVQLIRIRNPHGKNEFNGDYSDESPLWQSVSEAEKQRIGFQNKLDGEYWMKYTDMLECFTNISLVSLLDKDKAGAPPAVFEAYDGQFGSVTGDGFVVNTKVSSIGEDQTNAYIIADVTAKTSISKFIQLKLYPADQSQPEYPLAYAEAVEAHMATVSEGQIAHLDLGGTVYKIKAPVSLPITPVEGVTDAQNFGGDTVCLAWKVIPGDYRIIVSAGNETAGYTLRLLRFQ